MLLFLINPVQFSCSVISDSAIPWTAACQTSLSITNFPVHHQLNLKLMSVMPSNHLILCRPLLLLLPIPPIIRVFFNESLFTSSGQRSTVSVSTAVLPVNTQDWSPLGWISWISLQSKELPISSIV